jgi:aminomethyltransferase
VLHRGHGRVARKLVGLTLADGPVPPRGSVVQADARSVGEVTSAALSPVVQRPIALAYVQRDFISVGTALAIDGHQATVTALPFRDPGELAIVP